MSDGYGYVVVRRDTENDRPFEVGDTVTTYRLLEPLPVGAEPHSECDDDLADYIASVEPDLGDDSLWREERALFCPACPKGKGKKLLSIMIHSPSARRWVSPRGEKVPTSVKGRRAEAWPMHGAVGETPHVGDVASCPGCRARWLILSTHVDALLVRVEVGRYDAVLDS